MQLADAHRGVLYIRACKKVARICEYIHNVGFCIAFSE